jgi:hypothetical protein
LVVVKWRDAIGQPSSGGGRKRGGRRQDSSGVQLLGIGLHPLKKENKLDNTLYFSLDVQMGRIGTIIINKMQGFASRE